MLNYIPKYFTQKAIYIYLAALLIVSVMFLSKAMDWYWIVLGLIEVVGFFYYSNQFTRQWSARSEKKFVKDLFYISLGIRLVWVVFSYFFYILMTGQPFEFSVGDAGFYDNMGRFGSNLIARGNFNFLVEFKRYAGNTLAVSDTGYPIYLSFIYFITGKSIFLTRIIKAFIGAYTVILIYRLTTRNFGESTGRVAAVFAMLMPNLIYYTGLHLKETEMVFLTVAFIERADYAMRSAKFSFANLILPVLIAGVLFFFRTVLGATALFAFITALAFSSMKTMKKSGRRALLIGWVLLTIAYFMGGAIANEVEEVWTSRVGNQETSLEWRAKREGGNAFAKYASKSVFAPMIFVIPFPTMVDVSGQENQQLIHGGNYVKNILAFFTMFALFMLIVEKKWRDHLLIVAFTGGYLIVVAMSAFAHSERFHQPALPFLLILAAVGVSKQTNKTKKFYTWYLAFIFVAIVGWSWFKLAGRGMA